MMRNLYRLSCAALAAVYAIVLAASEGAAAPAAAPADPGVETEVCISPAVEAKVRTCPEASGANKFRDVSRAKVGISTKEKEVKKETEMGPGLERDYREKMVDSMFKRKREKKSIEILRVVVKRLKRLAENTPDSDTGKALIYKNIADAYKDFYDTYNFMARELDEQIFQAEKTDPKKSAMLKLQQQKLDEDARKYRELSIKAYVAIRDKFQDFPDFDEILFAIAYEIDQMAAEQQDKAIKSEYHNRAREYYRELIRKYPESRFIPHSWMAFGEYYFHEAKDITRATASYDKVIEWGEQDNPNYAIAMYYLAWCYYNSQEYQRSIDQFQKVIVFAKQRPENRDADAVAKRSRLELVDPFSKIGNPSQAWNYFQKVGGDQAHAMLERLANIYYDDGQWVNAVVVLHALQDLEVKNYRNNNGDDICAYQVQITRAVINSNPKAKQLEELERQLALYKKFNDEGNHDPKKVEKCASETTSIAWDQATQWHVEAVGSESSPGTKNRATMEATIGLYDAILRTFPDLDALNIDGFDEDTKPTNYRVAYYKADLYWTMEEWDKCGPAFDAVVELDPAGALTPEAAYGAVLCYDKSYRKNFGEDDKDRRQDLQAKETVCDQKCKECKDKCKGKGPERVKCMSACVTEEKKALKPRPLSDFEQGILKSYDRYICYVPKSEDLVKIKYRRARIYYEANMFEEAAVLFKEIATQHSSDELGVYAANLYLDCLNALGDMVEKPRPVCYDELASIVNLFMDTSKAPGKDLMQDEGFSTQIKSLKVGVLRKKAESLTKRERFKEAAEVYLDIYRNYSGVYDERGMCEVLFNTAINMESARLVFPAIKVRQKMIELYPDCEYSKKAAYYIGANYHAMQVFNDSADNYKQFAEKYAGEEEAPDALQNAVMFYIGLGLYDQAWAAVKLFEANYANRQPAQSASVFFSAGYIYLNEAKETGEKKAWDAARNHYLTYLKRYAKVKALDEMVQAYVFIGDSYWNLKTPAYKEAQSSYEKALKVYDDNAMEKVVENRRKAEMLNAAAKARFNLADLKFEAFKRVTFPEFKPEKKVPDKIQKWWDKKIGKEEVAKQKEIRKYRQLLVRWREITRKEAQQETTKEDANIQFEYWLEYSFKPWMDKKRQVLEEANKAFGAVVEMHVPEWEMAAAARAGDMQLEFMNALYNAPLPPMFKDEQELKDIYRQSMDEKAKPFRDLAVNLFGLCLNVSMKVRWFNENSHRCEIELNKLEPRQYPISEEIRIKPDNEYSMWAVPEAVLELESDAKKRDAALATSADTIEGVTEAQ